MFTPVSIIPTCGSGYSGPLSELAFSGANSLPRSKFSSWPGGKAFSAGVSTSGGNRTYLGLDAGRQRLSTVKIQLDPGGQSLFRWSINIWCDWTNPGCDSRWNSPTPILVQFDPRRESSLGRSIHVRSNDANPGLDPGRHGLTPILVQFDPRRESSLGGSIHVRGNDPGGTALPRSSFNSIPGGRAFATVENRFHSRGDEAALCD